MVGGDSGFDEREESCRCADEASVAMESGEVSVGGAAKTIWSDGLS